MKKVLMAALLFFMGIALNAQVKNMLGDWYTVDDETGEKLAIVHIYKATDGLYYGKITKLLRPDAEKICTQCPGADKGKEKVGLVIIRGMKEEDGILCGGRVLDPDKGKFYYAKMSLKDGKLVLRGSLDKAGILGRSQTWIRKK